MTNIVYLMADDLGFADLSPEFMPRSFALMQSLGTQLNFQTMQNCAPSRAALMTGQDPARYDMHGVDVIPNFEGIPTEVTMLSEHFQDAGYATGMFGKWHLGIDPDQSPEQQGFDELVGFQHGFISSYGSNQDGSLYADGTLGHDHHGNGQGIGHDMQQNEHIFRSGQYSTFVFRDAAQEFISERAQAGEDFFAYVPFNAPHAPYSAPAEYVALYLDRFNITEADLAYLDTYAEGVMSIPLLASVPEEIEARLSDLLFYSSVRAMDDAIADIYQTLIDEGVANDTVFMFASDNGAGVGYGRTGDNGDLREGKGTPYQGGHQVSNFMIWPNEVAVGAEIDHPIWIGDLAPTFLNIAGIQTNASFDGIDVTEVLRGNDTAPRAAGDVIVSHIYKFRGYPNEFNDLTEIVDSVGIAFLDNDMKYIYGYYYDLNGNVIADSLIEELYDLSNDPSETTNLLGDPAYAAELAAFRAEFDAYGYDGTTGDAFFAALETKDNFQQFQGYTRPLEWGDFSLTDPNDPRIAWRGDAEDNVITGFDDAESLWGAGGDDMIFGMDGDDFLRGGSGADALDGGAGTDEADYTDAYGGVLADLLAAQNNTGDALGDSYTSIENLRGSETADDLRGTGQANTIHGQGGNDVLVGRTGDDTLNGGNGDDILIGGRGADHLSGGDGIDQSVYARSAGAVTVDLIRAYANTGDAAGDTYDSIEWLSGTDGGDRLLGNHEDGRIDGRGGDDVLFGRGGDDKLLGGDGNDVIFGQDGNDRMWGGSGNDIFVFTDLSEGDDTIQDFVIGEDTLRFQNGLTFDDLTLSALGPSALIEYDGGTVILRQIDPSALSASDFEFI